MFAKIAFGTKCDHLIVLYAWKNKVGLLLIMCDVFVCCAVGMKNHYSYYSTWIFSTSVSMPRLSCLLFYVSGIPTHRGWVKKIRFAPGKGNQKLLVMYTDGAEVWDTKEVTFSSLYFLWNNTNLIDNSIKADTDLKCVLNTRFDIVFHFICWFILCCGCGRGWLTRYEYCTCRHTSVVFLNLAAEACRESRMFTSDLSA